jgi:AraC-like DNA-binding protein
MRPKLEIIPLDLFSSIAIKRIYASHIDYSHWHYHPEYEIIYIEKSTGIRLIGNHVGSFKDGDLVFISPNLPHLWKNNNNYYKGDQNLQADMYMIHFDGQAFGRGFFDIPELTHVKKLFSLGCHGILVKGKNIKNISALIKKAYSSSGFERIIILFKILDALANTPDFELLANCNWQNFIGNNNSKKINKVLSFIVKNSNKQIHLEEVAEIAHLNKSSFCRYFKSCTHKTYSRFLNEIRIAKACEILLNTDMNITGICYETGYNNISYFNRQFKLITGTTAREYRKKIVSI